MGKSGGRRKKGTVVTANAVFQSVPSTSLKPLNTDPSIESLKGNHDKNVMVTQRQLKLFHDQDIRLVQIPINCSFRELRDMVKMKFPTLDSVLIKYKDNDGDLVTITSTGELRFAESIVDGNGSIGILKLNVIEVRPEEEPHLIEEKKEECHDCAMDGQNVEIDDWLHEFAKLFCSRVGIESVVANKKIDLHELGIDFCTEALEETVTSNEAQDLFDRASYKFQEVAALAFFNWGNVHMCAARKSVRLDENENRILVMKESEFDFVKEKYYLAREKYEQAVVIKPDFYEGLLAIGQQQFELAKLHWYFGMANKIDFGKETLWFFDIAEEKMKAANEMWEKLEKEKLGEQGSDSMRSQIHLFWGNMLFERSQVEFKLGMSNWKQRLDASVERFKIAGASVADVSTILKKHCSNENAREGEVKAS